MIKKIIYTAVLSIGGILGVSAQQESQYTQYMYNTSLFNPAYTGSRGVGSFFGSFRSQWVGLEGAPTNGSISYHTPIPKAKGIAVGGSIFRETIGIEKKTSIAVDVAYTLRFEKSRLAFGIKGAANLFQINYDDLDLARRDVNMTGNESVFSPNIGAGIYWYTDKYYIGFSVPNMLETTHYKEGSVSILKNSQHLYLVGGYVFGVSDKVLFKPAILGKMVSGAPMQVDVSANFMFNEQFVLGAAYRWDAAVSALAGFQINERWFIGYSYDFETGGLSKYNSGSHEVFLRYELAKLYKTVVSPRFF